MKCAQLSVLSALLTSLLRPHLLPLLSSLAVCPGQFDFVVDPPDETKIPPGTFPCDRTPEHAHHMRPRASLKTSPQHHRFLPIFPLVYMHTLVHTYLHACNPPFPMPAKSGVRRCRGAGRRPPNRNSRPGRASLATSASSPEPVPRARPRIWPLSPRFHQSHTRPRLRWVAQDPSAAPETAVSLRRL